MTTCERAGQPRVHQRVLGTVVERVGEHLLLDTLPARWVLGQPASGPADGLAGRHDIAMTELVMQPGQVEHPVGRERLGQQGPGRHGQVVGQGHDLQVGPERLGCTARPSGAR